MRTERIGLATLYLGDCRDVLPIVNNVGLFFTSPPYNQNLQSFRPSGMHKESAWVERISGSYFDTMDESDYQKIQVEILNLCFSSAAEYCSLFYNHKLRWRDTVPIWPTEWLLRSKWVPRQEIIWARTGSVTQNARMFPPSEERIYWMRKNSWKWKRANAKWMSVWSIPPEANSEHPVAYPLELPKRAIACTTDVTDIVLDPYMGSGTTGVASVHLGRKFIGIEIEPKYFDLACRRIENAQRQAQMFDHAP